MQNENYKKLFNKSLNGEGIQKEMELFNSNKKQEIEQTFKQTSADDLFSGIDPNYKPPIGSVLYDNSASKTTHSTVISSYDYVDSLDTGTYLSIEGNGTRHLAKVEEGPFVSPQGMMGAESQIISALTRGVPMVDLDCYVRTEARHVGCLSEEGDFMPLSGRPLPNSRVRRMDEAALPRALKLEGDMFIGRLLPPHDVRANLDSTNEELFSKHRVILGITGAGKTTSSSNQISSLSKANHAQVIFDPEGEMTSIDEPANAPHVVKLLEEESQVPEGIHNSVVYHVAGKIPRNPNHHDLRPFSLQYDQMPISLVAEILGMNEAQTTRYDQAYHIARRMRREVVNQGVKPTLDVFSEYQEMGTPGMRLENVIDVVNVIVERLHHEENSTPLSQEFVGHESRLSKMLDATHLEGHKASWLKVKGLLYQLYRMKIFDVVDASSVDYDAMLTQGRVTVFDLSGTYSPRYRNLIVTQVLRGLRNAHEKKYKEETLETVSNITPLHLYVDEAHSLLSQQAIKKMPEVYEQLSDLAAYGRKRRIGLTLISHYPQQIGSQVFDMVGNFVVHRISNPATVSSIKKILGLNDYDAARLPTLEPGEAICHFPDQWRHPHFVRMQPGTFRQFVPSKD